MNRRETPRASGASRVPIEVGLEGYDGLSLIGRGGSGVVYKARERRLGRLVALKVLAAGTDEASYGRFVREMRILGSLSSHPNIVTVFRAGLNDMGTPYIEMEYLPAGSLSQRLRKGPLTVAQALRMTIRVCGALEVTHEAGVLHRDIKPENILLSDYDEPQLADFGIARVAGDHQTTNRGGHLTLAHAAPELLGSGGATRASDVYALASTLYTLLSCQLAFVHGSDEDLSTVVSRILRDPAPSLGAFAVPPALRDAVNRGMAKAPGQRPATAAGFGEELQAVQAGLGLARTEMIIAPALNDVTIAVETASSSSLIASSSHTLGKAVPRARWPVVIGTRWRAAAALTLILAMGAVLFAVLRPASQSAPTSGATSDVRPMNTPLDLFSPADAMAWLKYYDDGNNRVYSQQNLGLLQDLEEGSAYAIDNWDYRLYNACGATLAPIAYSDLHVYVPHQTVYPGYFLAVETFHATAQHAVGFPGQSTGSPCIPASPPAVNTYLLVFMRDGRDASWRLRDTALLAQPSQMPQIAIDPEGYALSALPSFDDAQLSGGQLALQLNAYFQTHRALAVNWFYPGTYAREAGPLDANVGFRLKAGGELIFFLMHGTADGVTDRVQGSLLRGDYRSITYTIDYSMAAVDQGTSLPRIIAAYEGPVSVACDPTCPSQPA